MRFPLYVSVLFIFFQIRFKQKAVLQSVHLNAFSPVCFILHVIWNQNYDKKQFCRVCPWMLFPLYISFIFFKLRFQQKSVLQILHLNILFLVFFPKKLQKQARLHSVHFNAFPLYVLISMLFQIKIQQKAVLQSLHLNVFPPVFFILHFLST